jgi:citrate lyase subunit beta/citryl-CoA lyase
MLFTPGNSMRMIARAGVRGADAVILDLEDAVPIEDKETARLFVRDSLGEVASGGSAVFVRVNASATGLLEEDLEWAVRDGLAGVMLPKAESADDVRALETRLGELEQERSLESETAIVPLIETPLGVLEAFDIASASARVAAVAFGGVDFSREMGAELTAGGEELAFARGRIGVASRAAGVPALDTPHLAARDREGVAASAAMARQLGFRGKLAIHPAQVATINEAFSPGEAQLARARAVVQAFEEARARGAGASSLDGRMIDAANYRQAKDVLETADAISSRGAPAG